MDYKNNNELLILAVNGDSSATEKLIENNLGLVRSIALRFKDRGVEYEDLVQIGSMGMLKAIRSFDISKGTVFSTYAVPLIIGEIKRFIRDDGLIKVSRVYKQQSALLNKERERYILEYGKEPKIEELSKICNLTPNEAVLALEATASVNSLSASLNGEDEGFTLENTLPSNTNEIDIKIDSIALAQAIHSLPSLWRKIITLRYLQEYSQQDTAKMLGLTQVKISREEKKIFEALRKKLS
ncbi:MAG: sigma-70 family RNA polymerase sigma factor [Ruminococcaceae bacterium]|nr:sigma-70 family RNA polymerase sigma factor [Oscillospiraceae bacterium]